MHATRERCSGRRGAWRARVHPRDREELVWPSAAEVGVSGIRVPNRKPR